MFLADTLFYIFSSILLSSALIVVSTKNTIYSVMFLILAFFNAAGLFILLKAEFLAMLLIIVYVGAIAVLFLFVVMMLNIDDKSKIKTTANKYGFISVTIATILFVEIYLIINSSSQSFDLNQVKSMPILNNISNIEAIGNVLYTDFAFPFQLSGMILFVAMIGAIVLTLRDQDRFIKKQNISEQVSRKKSDSVALSQPKTGKGINI